MYGGLQTDDSDCFICCLEQRLLSVLPVKCLLHSDEVPTHKHL